MTLASRVWAARFYDAVPTLHRPLRASGSGPTVEDFGLLFVHEDPTQ